MMQSEKGRPLALAVLYLLFGLFWVHGSDVLIAAMTSTVASFEQVSRFKGTVFVLLSAGLIYGALSRWRPVFRIDRFHQSSGHWTVLAGLLLIVLLMPTAGGTLSHWLEGQPGLTEEHWPWWLLTGVLAVLASLILLLNSRRQLYEALSRFTRHEALRREQLLVGFFDMPYIGMGFTDPATGRWLRANEFLQALLGFDSEALCQRDWQGLTHADDLEADQQAFERLMAGECDAYELKKRFVAASGEMVPVRIYVRLLRDPAGEPEHAICMVHDLRHEQAAQQALQRQSNLYSMLSRVNQLIVHSDSAEDVLASACRIAVEDGQMSFAWIGQCNDQGHIVSALAHAGDRQMASGVHELFEIFAAHPGQGLSEQAIAEGRTVVVNDTLSVVTYRPWHSFSRRYRCLSAISMPLLHQGRVFANLTLYADSVGFFTEPLVATLEEMASDIGFALDSLQRDQALAAAGQVINSSPYVLIRWKAVTGWPVEFVSDNVRRWGIEPEYLQGDSHNFAAMIHEQDRGRVETEVERYLAQGLNSYTQTYRLVLPGNRGVIWLEDRTHVQRDMTGKVQSIEGVLVDITARRQQEMRLQQAAAVLDSTREAVLITDANKYILQVNPAFRDMFGWSEADLQGRSTAVLRSGLHDDVFYRDVWHHLNTEGHWQGEIVSRRRHGELFPALLSISRLDMDEEVRFVGVYTDLSRLKDSESRLEHLSTHDALTGLPNRKALFRQLEHCSQYNRKYRRLSALLLSDLDNFRAINDSFGHLEGDQLLLEVARRFRSELSDDVELYHLGGDEFAVVLEQIHDEGDAAQVATRLMQQLQPLFKLSGGQAVQMSVSFGISLVDQSGSPSQQILQQADAALFRAKEQRGSLSFFSDDMTVAVQQRLAMEQSLRQALERQEFCLYYQPQWSTDGGHLTGVEALIRWQHPDRGMIPPAAFIPVAEQSGLIGQIGRWVLQEACRQVARWQAAGVPVPRVAVNVSPQQLHYHSLVDELAAALEESGIEPERLELEVTESALMSPGVNAEDMLQALREQGVRLAIDDFGTGYSSLAYLKRFPLDLLKIDKSFTDDLLGSKEAHAIVETIILLGHRLGLDVLAEGVETPAQQQALEQLACDHIQGYLMSRPLPVVELERLLRDAHVDL
ncbi:bifunctional diguanylate cyclase/phosphodiesterase [Marinobacterium weihaiense]|uniref:EAL domain-containing protein n=1 Tax=Marinobacterium weihaiense TaxID=2851016 RepID=A0ABS6M8Z9_9GAMM|nr:EAL domain-containing protein [Marinobacterium weihaiense]MBV0932753.1 EAL domain-containing protein [Marinobacterium weihaiense]